MRIQNGQWLLREGMATFSPAEIAEIRVVERVDQGQVSEELCLFMPSQKIYHKGQTLGGVVLELYLSAPAPGIVRLRTVHYRGVQAKQPQFALKHAEDSQLDWEENDDLVVVRSGQLTCTVNKETGTVQFLRGGLGGDVITQSSGKDIAYVKKDYTGDFYDRAEPGKSFMRQQLDLGVDELIYGMGEQFTPLVKNGQSVYIWNEDGGTSTDQSYKNVPFYLSNAGYGLLVNSTDRVEFEVATENVSKVAFSVPGETLDIYFIDGPDLKDVLQRYTDLSGKPALPSAWSFGLWLSTSFTTDYDEATVMHFIDGMLDRGIPLSVFHFDCCWMRPFHWMDFTWDARVFPDPAGMIQRIHDKGIKVCVWINPYIGQASPAFDVGAEKGYFLKRENGDVWQWDMWQPGCAIVDFTNPEAVEWYKDQLRALLDLGVDCFKTDFGERIPTDAVYHDGSDPVLMHNYYTQMFNQTVFELLQEEKGEAEAVLFARSATVGGQQFPVHWGGDCWSTYPSMAESLRGGLSLTMSGFAYWSHDIGGFEDQSTADVYKRWAAFGLLSTHSRLHGSTSYRVPWLYDDEAVEVVRYFTRLKLGLLPYLYSVAYQSSVTGIPMMRAMVLEHQDDPGAAYLDRQYYLGPSLLVAPIFNEQGEAETYLPAGRWTHYLSDETLDLAHGQWFKTQHDYFSLPLWVRENTVLPSLSLEGVIAGENLSFNEAYGDRLQLELFDLREGSFEVRELGDSLGVVRWSTDTSGVVTVELGDLAADLKVRTGDIEILEGEAIEGGLRPSQGATRMRFRYV